MTRLFFLLHKWRRTVQVYKPQLRHQRKLHKFHEVLTMAGVSRSKRQPSIRGHRSLSKMLQQRSAKEGMVLEQKRKTEGKARAERLRNEASTTSAASVRRARHWHPRSDKWEGENWSPLDIVAQSVDMQQAQVWRDWEANEMRRSPCYGIGHVR